MTPVKKDPEDRKDEWLKVRTNSDRLQKWRNAAALAKEKDPDGGDLDFSAWVRRALDRTARREKKKFDGPAMAKGGKGGGR